MGDTKTTEIRSLLRELRKEIAAAQGADVLIDLGERVDGLCTRIDALEADQAEREKAAREAEVVAKAVAGVEAEHKARFERWKAWGFAVAKGAVMLAAAGTAGGAGSKWGPVLLKLLGVDG